MLVTSDEEQISQGIFSLKSLHFYEMWRSRDPIYKWLSYSWGRWIREFSDLDGKYSLPWLSGRWAIPGISRKSQYFWYETICNNFRGSSALGHNFQHCDSFHCFHRSTLWRFSKTKVLSKSQSYSRSQFLMEKVKSHKFCKLLTFDLYFCMIHDSQAPSSKQTKVRLSAHFWL